MIDLDDADRRLVWSERGATVLRDMAEKSSAATGARPPER